MTVQPGPVTVPGLRGAARVAGRSAAGGRGSSADPRAAADVRGGRGGCRIALVEVDQAAGTDVPGRHGHGPPAAGPQRLKGGLAIPGWSVTTMANALAPNPAAADRERASAACRCPRTAMMGPACRWAESLSMSRSSKRVPEPRTQAAASHGGRRTAGWRPGSPQWTAGRRTRCTPPPPVRVPKASAGTPVPPRDRGTAGHSSVPPGGC